VYIYGFCSTVQVLLEMGGLCNSVGYNQVHYEISVEQLIVGKLQVSHFSVKEPPNNISRFKYFYGIS
jgi:hypothetical protein